MSIKKLLTTGLFLASTLPAMAATATGTATVSATLTPLCTVSSPTVTLTYTSFQATAKVERTALDIKCTSEQAYTVGISAASETIAGLTYSVALTNSTGTALTSGKGSGVTQSDIHVEATIAGNQGGTATSPGSSATYTASKTHTVTVTY